jgi:uncharacterized protein (DUF1499 family)
MSAGYVVEKENKDINQCFSMKKYVVLVTSAIYTNYGIYSPKERILQTIDTIRSIKTSIPGSVIVLVDNSKTDIHADNSSALSTLLNSVDYYIDNSNDANIKYFHDSVQNYDVGKNMMEAIGIFNALYALINNKNLHSIVANSSRVFKISGRYKLTSKFIINNFDNPSTEKKYIFKTRQPSWIPFQITGVTSQLQTRLWCFDSTLLPETAELYKTIINNMLKTINSGGYIDNEHSMSKFIPADKLIELSEVGIEGCIAPNGVKVID